MQELQSMPIKLWLVSQCPPTTTTEVEWWRWGWGWVEECKESPRTSITVSLLLVSLNPRCLRFALLTSMICLHQIHVWPCPVCSLDWRGRPAYWWHPEVSGLQGNDERWKTTVSNLTGWIAGDRTLVSHVVLPFRYPGVVYKPQSRSKTDPGEQQPEGGKRDHYI